MKFTLFNRRKKTIFSVATAVTLALVLAGCSTPPDDTEEVPAEDVTPAESSALPNTNGEVAPEQAANDSGDTDSPTSIAWLTSYNNALQEAKQKDQPIMIDFYADWCTACKVMDKEVYAQPNVIEKSLSFVNLRLDADQEADIVARYKIYALPTLIFLNGDGKVLWRVEGAPTAPYFMETMQKVQDKYTSNT